MRRVSLADVREMCLSALVQRSGMLESSGQAIADVVCAAELDGARSHGLFRLPGYVGALLHNKVDGRVEPSVVVDSESIVVVDGGGGFAPPAYLAGLPLLAEKAKRSGVACLAIRRSCHFGALWYECEALAEKHGLASCVYVNSKSFMCQPGGNGRRLWGTNPMAFGWPRASNLLDSRVGPLIFDQASAAMARGEIQMRAEANLAIDDHVAVDRNGLSTTDPREALLGSQLPFGGLQSHKGANIAMMVEILAAGLSGGNFGFESHDQDPSWYGPTENGQLIIALDPNAFVDDKDGREAMDLRIESVIHRMEDDGGRVPGSRRHNTRTKRLTAAGYNESGEDYLEYPTDLDFESHIDIDISSILYEEIQHIIAGGMNKTQGYVKEKSSAEDGNRHSDYSNATQHKIVPVILEKDLEEQFVKGSGPGGQKINKVRNCVVLKHKPTGISTRCQKTRSLETNRKIARRDLALKVDYAHRGDKSVRGEQEHRKREKKRRKKARSKRRHLSKKSGSLGSN